MFDDLVVGRLMLGIVVGTESSLEGSVFFGTLVLELQLRWIPG